MPVPVPVIEIAEVQVSFGTLRLRIESISYD